MTCLGIASFIHDASAAIVGSGAVHAAVEEERFSREKHDAALPVAGIEYCLREAATPFRDLDGIGFYWNPWRGIFPRALEVLRAMPGSLTFFNPFKAKDEVVRGDFKSWMRMARVGSELGARFGGGGARVSFVDHHLAHAASTFFVSPYEEALILTVDGNGEVATTLAAHGQGANIIPLHTVAYPHSLGLLYGAATQYLGYRVRSDEWKVMGLAAYGSPRYAAQIRQMVALTDEGWFRVDPTYFSYGVANQGNWYSSRWVDCFGPSRLSDQNPLDERFCDIASSVQLITEEVMVHMVRGLFKRSPLRKLCLAGGVCLNSVANGKLYEQTDVESIYVQPAAHDAGAALGAALYVEHVELKLPRVAPLDHAYLGPSFDTGRCRHALVKAGLNFTEPESLEEHCAELLADGKVLGWFQGRMEFGPRALGARSILADPRRAEMKDHINAMIKFREDYRPFAPMVLEERAAEFFTLREPSPFMLIVTDVRDEWRSRLGAVTHVDGTARIQTVNEQQNSQVTRLLKCFERRAGIPVLLNTSFNVKDEPIVCSPEDAVRCYQRSGIDALALGPYVVTKG